MMGVSIGSVTLSFLALVWSSVCIISDRVGNHLRASEFLILLSVLGTASVITTYGMFMFKNRELIQFRFFGFSFWMSVGASCGLFLGTILFAIDRVNIGFTYELNKYQDKYQISQ